MGPWVDVAKYWAQFAPHHGLCRRHEGKGWHYNTTFNTQSVSNHGQADRGIGNAYDMFDFHAFRELGFQLIN
jgi:hypothetical protein